MTARLLAGASGYSFKEWKGAFYPEKIKPEDMLAFYGERLPTVEINNTFYRMPKTEVLENWARTVPDSFRFAIKASRRITHFARLKAEECAEHVRFLYQQLAALGVFDKLVWDAQPADAARIEARIDGELEQCRAEAARQRAVRHRHLALFARPGVCGARGARSRRR